MLMSTDHEVTTVVETADVQCNAAITGCEVITGGDTVDVLHNAATAGGEVVTGSDVCNVQYNAAAAGAQPVSSFTVDSSHDHVAMATSSALAGDKTIHAPDERASTFTAIQSSSNLSTLKASSTMANSNEVHGTSSELLVPKIGMAFKSEEDAYEFYNEYAGKIGFSIRKSHSKLRPDKSVYQKHIVCSNEGERGTHSKHDTLKQNAATRSSCDARIQFSITREGVWTVQKVVLEHNHYLASPDKRHMLRSQRRLVESDKLVIGHMREAGLKPAQVFKFFKQWYGGPQHVPFLRVDSNNYIGRKRKKYLDVNDAQTMLEFLKNKQLEDPYFFYAIQLDEQDCRIANFFWADGQSIMDYACFGDALSFDTTFQTNKFEMPFAPLLGTNHHKQTILFGAALLFDETTDSFIWLFNTFLTAMSGKRHVTIFTDQCAAMAKAIDKVFPGTKHRLCLWHIYQNAAKHLSHVISNHPRFLADFKRVVYLENSVAYFEKKWQELLITYDLVENSWIQTLYGLREKWAAVYRNDSFSADMTSTQRSEGMNNVFKKQFRKKLCLSELVVEYEKCVASLRENELDADFKSRKSKLVPFVRNLPMLKTAAESYTRRIYTDYEEEFKQQHLVKCEIVSTVGTVRTYKVMAMQFEDDALVTFNHENVTISCSCRKYESKGLLCKHALRVFNINEVITLPSQYILHRWTKYAKREELLVELEKAIDMLDLEADESLSQRGPAKPESVAMNLNVCSENLTNANISFKVPQAIKGPMVKRAKDALEKKGTKKAKSGTKKPKSGTKKGSATPTILSLTIRQAGSFEAGTSSNSTVPHFTNTTFYGDSSTMFRPFIQGGYTELLLQTDQAPEVLHPSRRLDFDQPNPEGRKE
ncbi:hypothetical protein ACQ4PT_024510 [Festuca glaucescens]